MSSANQAHDITTSIFSSAWRNELWMMGAINECCRAKCAPFWGALGKFPILATTFHSHVHMRLAHVIIT